MNLRKFIELKLLHMDNSDHGLSQAKLAGIKDPELKSIHEESILATTHLQYIVFDDSLDEAQLEAALKRFLRIRWAYIQQSNAAYVEFPLSPMNTICQDFATVLAKKNESRVQILMPSILEKPYIHADNLKELVDDRATSPLNLDRLIVSEDNKHLIPIVDWFGLQKGTTPNFNHLYLKENQPVPLTVTELNLLKQSAGSASNDFFHELDLREKMKTTNGTFAQALGSLIHDLKEYGENGKQNKGSARRADERAYVSIRYFLDHTWYRIDSGLRAELANSKSSSYTLESLLLVLRAPLPGEILSDSEKQKLTQEKIINCIDTISAWLIDILNDNLDAFSKIKISEEHVATPGSPGKEKKLTSLDRRYLEVEEAIKARNKQLFVRYGDQACSLMKNKWVYSNLLDKSLTNDTLEPEGKIDTVASLTIKPLLNGYTQESEKDRSKRDKGEEYKRFHNKVSVKEERAKRNEKKKVQRKEAKG